MHEQNVFWFKTSKLFCNHGYHATSASKLKRPLILTPITWSMQSPKNFADQHLRFLNNSGQLEGSWCVCAHCSPKVPNDLNIHSKCCFFLFTSQRVVWEGERPFFWHGSLSWRIFNAQMWEPEKSAKSIPCALWQLMRVASLNCESKLWVQVGLSNLKKCCKPWKT